MTAPLRQTSRHPQGMQRISLSASQRSKSLALIQASMAAATAWAWLVSVQFPLVQMKILDLFKILATGS